MKNITVTKSTVWTVAMVLMVLGAVAIITAALVRVVLLGVVGLVALAVAVYLFFHGAAKYLESTRRDDQSILEG